MDQLANITKRIKACTDCPLHAGRTHPVPGEGPDDAEIMFIAEGPGQNEDKQGRPFVGPAGKALEELLSSINMTRDQVYITNMIKCRAPGNRDPEPREIAACRKHLDQQIETINPSLIVTLGRFSLAKFITGQTISQARGKVRREKGKNIYPIMHPAAGLRNRAMKQAIADDFSLLPNALKLALHFPPDELPATLENTAPEDTPPDAEQTGLF